MQDALNEAQINEENDTINVVQGVYTGNFTYEASNGYSLTIKGGYTAGCQNRKSDPSNTVLDGNESGRVMYLLDTAGANITVDGFTIKGGNAEDSEGGGGGIFVRSSGYDAQAAGDVILKNNVIIDNKFVEGNGAGAFVSSYAGRELQAAGNISLVNNILAGNKLIGTGPWRGAGVFVQLYSRSGPAGEIQFLNNTVTENLSSGNGAGAYLFSTSSDGTDVISVNNNIIRNNEGGYAADLYLSFQGQSLGYYNNYHDMGGYWSDSAENIDTDPGFVSPGYWNDNGTPEVHSDDIWTAGNYHLKADSSCIDAGLLGRKIFLSSPSPGFWYIRFYGPETDFENHARTVEWQKINDNDYRAYCEIGADEYKPMAMPWLLLLLSD